MSLGSRLYCSATLAPGVAESAMVGGGEGGAEWCRGRGFVGAAGAKFAVSAGGSGVSRACTKNGPWAVR